MAHTVSRDFTGSSHQRARSVPHSADLCGVKAIAAEEARRQPSDWLDVVGYGGLSHAAGSVGAELRGHHAEEQHGVRRDLYVFAPTVPGK